MRKIFLLIAITTAVHSFSQEGNRPSDFKPKLGFKVGYNWSYVTGEAQGFNKDSKSGFMVAGFFSPSTKGLGYRTEIVFSRQGYSFENGGQNTDVMQDYIYLPQLTTYTIGNRVQFQLGAQIGFLLNAKKTTASKDSSISEIMNKLDYGFAGGIELYPMKNLIIGGRYNLGLGKLYKQDYTSPNPYPLPFNPETANFKNSIIQFFVGLRF
jgi:hypothetical protein